MTQTVLVTGASGVAGRATCLQLRDAGFIVKMADAATAPLELRDIGEFVRCDTRTPSDCREAVRGSDAIVHLAAWHCAHNPPVSDDTIWAVNTDGFYNILQAGREFNVQALVYASSMAYGHGGVYSLTKVVGEEMARGFHAMTGAGVAMLRYHDFVPKPYLAFGEKLLRNGVDGRDVAASNVASVQAALKGNLGVFRSIIHTDHHFPPEVRANFRDLGSDWCESQLPGSRALIEKYDFDFPVGVEQHDLSEAREKLGWTPKFGFVEFLRDLQKREQRGDDVRNLWAPGQLPSL